MKKYMAILLLVFFVGIALPQKSQAFGDFIEPTSVLYFMQEWKESLGLFFSFSQESKLNYHLRLSEKRASELRDFGKNDAQIAQMLANKYQNNYRQMEKIAAQMENKNQVAEKIKNGSVAQQETLARVYGQVPEQAKAAILNAQENSSKNVSAVLEKVSSEDAMEYVQKIQQIQQTQKTEMMQKTPMVEKEAGNENGNPDGNGPKSLNEANDTNEIKQGKDLNQTNGSNGSGGAAGRDSQEKNQPAEKAPVQSPASKR